MKVYIGPYTTWFGPYQLAELLCFWAKPVEDEYGYKRKPDFVHNFGEWLAHGSVEPEPEVGDISSLFIKDRPQTLLYKAMQWIESKRKRAIFVKIDKYDTWGMDHTLAFIILPMLKQLKATKHGAPIVDDEDVPEHLKSTATPPKENEWDTDGNHFKRWDWVLDEMIFAFESQFNNWAETFHSGVSDWQSERLENGMSRLVKGPNDTSHYDAEGAQAYQARVSNGYRLFGKYYENLWD